MMGCGYCTPHVDPDTGESLEFCDEFFYLDKSNNDTLVKTCLIQDRDDGSWWMQVLMSDRWKERLDISHFPLITTYEAPPFCPHCGRRLT